MADDAPFSTKELVAKKRGGQPSVRHPPTAASLQCATRHPSSAVRIRVAFALQLRIRSSARSFGCERARGAQRIVSYSPPPPRRPAVRDDDVCALGLAALCGPRLRRLNLFWTAGLGLRAVADRGPPLCALNLGGVRCIMDEDLGYMLQRCCAGLPELR
eukprot:tig00000042_g15545.t1